MNEALKVILRDMLTELEDLRASNTVLLEVLRVLPECSRVDFPGLKETIRDKNSASFAALRKAIDELA